MRKLIITGMAVAMLAVPAAASAGGPTGSTVCDQDHPVAHGSTITTNLTVPAGKFCDLSGDGGGWSTIKGNVTVNGVMFAQGVKFEKNVAVDGGIFRAVNDGSTITGNMSIKNSTGSLGLAESGFWNTTRFTVVGNYSVTDSNAPYMGGTLTAANLS